MAYDNNELRKISEHPTWKKLLHFEAGYFHASISEVNSQSFFLHEHGSTDAYLELQATIQAFQYQADSQCVFPARLIFLQKVLPKFQFPSTDCPQYDAYLTAFQTESLSIVYASGYLGNPASMYGHVFLKFNGHEEHSLLDNTFSFGAKVPENEPGLVYVTKGMFGGYDGRFTNQKYHHQHLTYNESELRDLWEYELTLDKREVQFLLAHLYELEKTQMVYYFFKQNCAYQLAKLLELVIDTPLIAPEKPWVMPYDVIAMLDRHDNNGELIEDITYKGSRQELLYAKWGQLTKKDKKLVLRLISSPADEVATIISQVDTQNAIQIIETMYDYLAFIDVKQDGLDAQQISKRKALVKARFALPAGGFEWQAPLKKAPHTAQDTAMLQASVIHNNEFGALAELRFRANYYDLLSVNAARIPFSELSTLDARLTYSLERSEFDLRELTLIKIVNLNVSNTGLPQDSGYAWKVAIGYKPESLACANCSTAYADGFIGKAWSTSANWAAYGALAFSATGSNRRGGNISIGPEIGGVINLAPGYAVSLAIGQQSFVNDLEKDQQYLAFEQRFFEHRRFDIRSSVKYLDALEYALNFTLYY